LIHTDVHAGNFFVDDGRITVFDFDDSSYQWFASDIAIALYYTIWRKFDGHEQREKDTYAPGVFGKLHDWLQRGKQAG